MVLAVLLAIAMALPGGSTVLAGEDGSYLQGEFDGSFLQEDGGAAMESAAPAEAPLAVPGAGGNRGRRRPA